MSDDILQIIIDTDLIGLRDIFKNNWPYASHAYTFVDHWISYKNQNQNVGVEFTCPNGDWSDGTFVAMVTEFEYVYHIFFFTLQRPCDRLTHALRATKRINWAREPCICAIHEDIDKECMQVLKNIGHSVDYERLRECWWLPKEKAIDFKIRYPVDFYSASLTSNQAELINSIWLYRFPKSEYVLAKLIDMNIAIGVYDKTTNKLCSWMMINDIGGLGILQTDEKYKRKKLASELVKDLSKRKAELGLDSITYIGTENITSQQLFEKLGYVKINNVRWVQLKEKDC